MKATYLLHILTIFYTLFKNFLILPGKPAQNAYIERFNRTFREDVWDAYLFDDLDKVCEIAERWLEDYNTIRPHEALQGLSPRQFEIQQNA